jgi:hypothetical protein
MINLPDRQVFFYTKLLKEDELPREAGSFFNHLRKKNFSDRQEVFK